LDRPAVQPAEIEGYFHLEVLHWGKKSIQNWLDDEFKKSRGCPKPSEAKWDHHPEITDGLP
jgi:hypothetical protein